MCHKQSFVEWSKTPVNTMLSDTDRPISTLEAPAMTVCPGIWPSPRIIVLTNKCHCEFSGLHCFMICLQVATYGMTRGASPKTCWEISQMFAVRTRIVPTTTIHLWWIHLGHSFTSQWIKRITISKTVNF